MDERLARLEHWCNSQTAREDCDFRLRLICGVPLSDEELDSIPRYPLSFPFETAIPYQPENFSVPASYRQLLSMSGGFRIEYQEKDSEEQKWEVWPVVELFRPGSCEQAHRSGGGPTLCDSWVTSGTTVDEREIDVTRFISFANAGMSSEASRWSFMIGPGVSEPTIYLEDNDYECLTGHWADSGEWISEHSAPVFSNFSDWLEALVDVVTHHTLDDPEDTDQLIDAVFQHPRSA